MEAKVVMVAVVQIPPTSLVVVPGTGVVTRTVSLFPVHSVAPVEVMEIVYLLLTIAVHTGP
jgi:hypothetical protein